MCFFQSFVETLREQIESRSWCQSPQLDETNSTSPRSTPSHPWRRRCFFDVETLDTQIRPFNFQQTFPDSSHRGEKNEPNFALRRRLAAEMFFRNLPGYVASSAPCMGKRLNFAAPRWEQLQTRSRCRSNRLDETNPTSPSSTPSAAAPLQHPRKCAYPNVF